MSDPIDLFEIEERAHRAENIPGFQHAGLTSDIFKLTDEVRRLQHELADPRYLYSGRINRIAITSRNAEIDALRARVRELEKAAEKKS